MGNFIFPKRRRKVIFELPYKTVISNVKRGINDGYDDIICSDKVEDKGYFYMKDSLNGKIYHSVLSGNNNYEVQVYDKGDHTLVEMTLDGYGTLLQVWFWLFLISCVGTFFAEEYLIFGFVLYLATLFPLLFWIHSVTRINMFYIKLVKRIKQTE